MKFLKSGLIALSIVVLLAACNSVKKDQKAENRKVKLGKAKEIKANLGKIAPKDADEAKKFALSQAENYYKALTKNDYEAFCKSKKLSKKDFKKWRQAVTKAYGTLESQEYVGSVKNDLIIRYMWKWNFKRKAKGETITRQALYNVFVVKDKKKKKYVLFSTGLQ